MEGRDMCIALFMRHKSRKSLHTDKVYFVDILHTNTFSDGIFNILICLEMKLFLVKNTKQNLPSFWGQKQQDSKINMKKSISLVCRLHVLLVCRCITVLRTKHFKTMARTAGPFSCALCAASL